ncbi:hypothetical protein COO60DRAFT_547764 [Scenedesmus sp. NREL 46B-D3]|nr:hypothetical protein COO60DRAFT_547764 [Scenedesmus sp. NREL 46B-D3]
MTHGMLHNRTISPHDQADSDAWLSTSGHSEGTAEDIVGTGLLALVAASNANSCCPRLATADTAGGCRRRTTANNFIPGGATRQQQPSCTSAVQDSPAGTPGTYSPLNGGGACSPDSDSWPPIGDGAAAGVGGLSGLLPSWAGDAAGVGALGLRSHARRLSQRALDEFGNRFDGRATNALTDRGELEQQRRVFDSGISADRTTLVLGRSASWKVAAGRSRGPSADFGPLADLVDSVVADGAADSAAAAAAAAAEGTAGGLLALGPARTNAAAAAAADDSGRSKGHVPHKVALGYMLLPEYVQTAALNRLKASLASMSAAQPQLLPATPGGTQFELLLLALTARLSQWPQVERQAEQVFQQMLHTMMDNIFARLTPSRGGAALPSRERHAPAPTAAVHGDAKRQPTALISSTVAFLDSAAGAVESSSPGHGKPAAAAGSNTSTPERSAGGSSAQRASNVGAGGARSSAAAGAAATAADEAASAPAKLSDSMVHAAFAKLALGQAMLRGMPGTGARRPQQPQLEPQQHTPGAVPSPAQQPAATTGPPAASGADIAKQAVAESAAGTPDVGLTPALSRAGSSTCSSQCLTFNRLTSKQAEGTSCQLQHGLEQLQQVQRQQPLQWPGAFVTGQAVHNSSSSLKSRNRTTLDRLSAAAGQLGEDSNLQMPWQQQQHVSNGKCQQQRQVPVACGGSNSRSSSCPQAGSRLAAATSSRSALPAQWMGDAVDPLPSCQQRRQQHSTQSSQQLRSVWGSPVQQHQLNHDVEGRSWLLPEQRQQWQQEGRQRPAQCARLGAWLPSAVNISPGKATLQSKSSRAVVAQPSCSSSSIYDHQQQQQQQRHGPWQQQQQQQQLHSDQAQQLLLQSQQRPCQTCVLPRCASSVPDLQQLSSMQQQSPCSHDGSPSSAAYGAGPAGIARRATVSKTLAGMQQQHEQEQRRQQQMQVQSWLQAKQARHQGRQGCAGSPGSISSSPSTRQAGNGSPRHPSPEKEWQQLATARAGLQQPARHQGLSTTAVRVSTSGAQAALSQPSMHMPLDDGCIDVYTDGVEVRSTNMLVISICSSPTQPQTTAAATGSASTEQPPAVG